MVSFGILSSHTQRDAFVFGSKRESHPKLLELNYTYLVLSIPWHGNIRIEEIYRRLFVF